MYRFYIYDTRNITKHKMPSVMSLYTKGVLSFHNAQRTNEQAKPYDVRIPIRAAEVKFILKMSERGA